MGNLKKGVVAAILVLFQAFFANPTVSAEEATPEEKAEVIRNLIIQLNASYAAMNKSLKELEEGIRSLPDTVLDISLRKRDKDVKLLSIDIKDNDRPFESHLYLPAENEALDAGGRHQIFHGAVKDGTHLFKAAYFWKRDGDPQAQRGEATIPITIVLGKSYYVDLSVIRTGDRVELLFSQLDFSSR